MLLAPAMRRRYAALIKEGKSSAEAMAILNRESSANNAAALESSPPLVASLAKQAFMGSGSELPSPADASPDDNAGGNSTERCYCTLITSEDFVPGLIAMLHSLAKTRPHYKHVVVLVTSQVGPSCRRKLLAKLAPCAALHVEILDVPAIANPNAAVHVQGWINAGYTKLHIFNMTSFEKVVYIDADTLILDNVDHLFERPGTPLSAAPDVFPPDKFNAGVLVVTPKASVFEKMTEQLSDTQSHDGGDTGFLNTFFPEWYSLPSQHRLPFRFNAQRTMHWLTFSGNPGYWLSIRPVAILHFSSNPKPWNLSDETNRAVTTTSAAEVSSNEIKQRERQNPSKNQKGELEMIWWHYFMESQLGIGSAALGPPPFQENILVV